MLLKPKNKSLYILIISFLLLSSCLSSNKNPFALVGKDAPFNLANNEVRFIANVAYGAHPQQRFDIFLPESNTPTPLVIFFHGGAFVSGTKDSYYSPRGKEYQAQINQYLQNGIAFANVNYRLLKNDKTGVLKSLSDAKYSLQFIRYYAEQFNINKERIALSGFSAGAGMAMWLGFFDDKAQAEASDPVERESTKVLALGLREVQATYDIQFWEDSVFAPYGFKLKDLLGIIPPRMLKRFYGVKNIAELYSEEIKDYRKQVDYLAQMDNKDPPFWLQQVSTRLERPKTIIAIFHHPYQAQAVKLKASSVELKNYAYIRDLFIPRQVSEADFIIDIIAKAGT